MRRVVMAAIACFTVSSQPVHSGPKEPSQGAGDEIAKARNELLDPKIARLSGSMYLAIRAVDEYRRSKQKKTLKASELVLENFAIGIAKEDPWLTREESGVCLMVWLTPKYGPGDEAALDDYATSLGRSATYAVRKKDYVVVRASIRGSL